MGESPDATEVYYEVWRTHLRGGPDVRIGRASSPALLAECEADKASAYPDAPIEFYLVRATTTRERMPAAERTPARVADESGDAL